MVTTTLRRPKLSAVFPFAKPLLSDARDPLTGEPVQILSDRPTGIASCSKVVVPFAKPVATEEADSWAALDPLGSDAKGDFAVDTTARALVRLVYVAAQVGQRFRDENLTHDPVAWMMAPRELFAGRCAMEACRERPDFVLATLLYGLSLGLDADPGDLRSLLDSGPGGSGEPDEDVDDVFADPEGDEDEDASSDERPRREGGVGDKHDDDWDDPIEFGTDHLVDALTDGNASLVSRLAADPGPLSTDSSGSGVGLVASGPSPSRLFTAMVTNEIRGHVSHLFHASMAADEESFEGTVRERLGTAAAREMRIMEGVDWSSDVVGSIMDSELCCLLDELEDSGGSGADGLDVWVERRLPSEAVFA